MQINPDSQQIIALLNKPLSLIRQSGNLGIKGVKRLIGIIFLFALSNLILDIYAIVSLILSNYTHTKLLNLLLLIITGIGITAFAAYKAYQYLMINALQVIYTLSKETIQNVCYNIVLKADQVFNSESFKNKTQSEGVQTTTAFIAEFYEKQPTVLKKGLQLVFKRIPLATMLFEMRTEILKGNHKDSSEKLFGAMDAFLTRNIFEANNTKWLGWLLPTNILLFYLWIDLVIS